MFVPCELMEKADVLSGQPTRILHASGAVAIVVGIVVGAGIFKTPSMVAELTGDAGWLLAVWVAGALISLAGALCYAELCTTHPHAGGDYHFLSQAYGKNLSFLYAWAKSMVINTGSIALLAYVFGDYMSQVIGLGPHSSALWAVAIVVLLTITNILGLRNSAKLQTGLIVLVLLGLGSVVWAGFFSASAAGAPREFFGQNPPLGLLGLSMVFVLLTFGGWNEAAYVSAEVRGGPRAIAGVLIVSLAIITGVYLLVNMALLWGLGLSGLVESKTAATDVLAKAVGPGAAKVLGLLVALAALTSINSTMIVGARTNYALGRDWTALRRLGRWEEHRGVSVASYLFQAALSLALVGFGAFQADGFNAMVEFTAPVFWLFLFLVGVSVFILRRKNPSAHRPFTVPLYPFTPMVFCVACAYLTYSSVTYAAGQQAVHVSLLVMTAGLVTLLVLNLRTSQLRQPPGASV
jgi:APA family basic amino acid/polyamine antiporter